MQVNAALCYLATSFFTRRGNDKKEVEEKGWKEINARFYQADFC